MVVPSFGFGSIKNVRNPLLFSILREYCEELFDYKEMESIDRHVNPYWFYDQFAEIKALKKLYDENKLQLLLTGCGFDLIGGFFNLETLLVIDDEIVAKQIYENCNGNWETSGDNIQFIPLNSPLLEKLLSKNKIAPTSAFAIQRAIQILGS